MLLAAFVLILAPRTVEAQPGAPATLDLEMISEPLDAWERVASSGSAETARYALYQLRRRPLLVLSWRPLRADERQLGRDVALGLAGQSLGRDSPFPLEPGSLREWTHLGHPGWAYASAEAGDLPRVLIWPCPATDRLFVAELSLDRELETDPDWLEVLEAIVSSIACHGPVRQGPPAAVPLDRIVLRDQLHLGLRLPAAWRAGLLDPGSTAQQGSLWAASTKSVGLVLLRRRDDRSGTLREFLQTTVDLLPVALGREGRTVQVIQESVRRAGQEWEARGFFRVEDREWEWIDGEHRFAIRAFPARGEHHAILVSWRATGSVKGVPLDLQTPWSLVEALLDRASSAYYP